MSYSISNELKWETSPLLIPFCSLSCSSILSQASLLHGIRDSSPWKRPQGAPNSCSAGLDLSLLTTCSVIIPFQPIFLFSLFEYLLVLNKEFACSGGDLGLIPVRRSPGSEWQHAPVFFPGKPHGQRSLVGYNSWGHKELDVTEQLSLLHNNLAKKILLFYDVETEAQNTVVCPNPGLVFIILLLIFPSSSLFNMCASFYFNFISLYYVKSV